MARDRRAEPAEKAARPVSGIATKTPSERSAVIIAAPPFGQVAGTCLPLEPEYGVRGYVPLPRLIMIRMIAGPRITMNIDGKMQPTSGKSILIGALAAISSAR